MSQVLLVRHGQASWGSDDYDVLSDLGERQSRMLGEALAARGVVPDLVVADQQDLAHRWFLSLGSPDRRGPGRAGSGGRSVPRP